MVKYKNRELLNKLKYYCEKDYQEFCGYSEKDMSSRYVKTFLHTRRIIYKSIPYIIDTGRNRKSMTERDFCLNTKL